MTTGGCDAQRAVAGRAGAARRGGVTHGQSRAGGAELSGDRNRREDMHTVYRQSQGCRELGAPQQPPPGLGVHLETRLGPGQRQ